MKKITKILLAVFLTVGITGSFGVNAISPQCYNFNYNMGKGSFSTGVFNLQNILMSEGLLYISQPTSYFGNLTFSAVKNFQAKYGILQTGFVGPITRAKLNTMCGNVGQNHSPVISGVSGPTSLNTYQVGTWTVSVSSPLSGNLSYSVVWGDEVYPSATGSTQSPTNYNQTATFNHTYTTAKLYWPTFYVRDTFGNVTSSSISVSVVNSTTPVIQYLQPTSGPINSMVTIVGTGFTQTGNRIVFGNLNTENNPVYSVNSPNGTTLTFQVPQSNYMACWYSNPACMSAAMVTQPGNYQVSVINGNGVTSNQMTFTVTSSSSCTPNWQCGWGPCSNGWQSMTAVDSNYCGVPYQGTPPIGCPLIAQQCY